MASTLSEVSIKISADSVALNKQLSGIETAVAGAAKRMADTIEKSMLALTGTLLAAGAGIFALTKASADVGDELAKMSQKVGISVESLSGYRLAAGLAGTSLEDLGTALQKASRAIYAARDGTGEAADAFQQLGISVTDGSGNLKTAEQVMLEVSDRFATMGDGAQKTALAMAIFGKSGAGMIPMLNEGSKALAQQRAEADLLGVTWTSAQAKMAEAFNDNFERIEAGLAGFRNAVAAYILPFANEIETSILAKIKEWGKSGDLRIWALSTGEAIVGAFVTGAEAVASVARAAPLVVDSFRVIMAGAKALESSLETLFGWIIKDTDPTRWQDPLAAALRDANAETRSWGETLTLAGQQSAETAVSWWNSIGTSNAAAEKFSATIQGLAQRFREWGASAMMSASLAMQAGQAAEKPAAAASKSIQELLKDADKAWTHMRAMGQVSTEDEIAHLAKLMNEAGRTKDERWKAEEELFKLTQDTADKLFAHEEALGRKSLQENIDFEKRKAAAAIAGTERQMKAQEDAFRFEEEQRKKRQQAALGILGEAIKALEEERPGETYTKADVLRKTQEIQLQRGQQASGVQQWAAGQGALTGEELLGGYEAAGKLNDLNETLGQLGGIGKILQGGAQVKLGKAMEEIPLATRGISQGELSNLFAAGRPDLAERALAQFGSFEDRMGGGAITNPGEAIGAGITGGMSDATMEALTTFDDFGQKLVEKANDYGSKIAKTMYGNIEEWFVRKLMFQAERG